jgi:hypothetical protein
MFEQLGGFQIKFERVEAYLCLATTGEGGVSRLQFGSDFSEESRDLLYILACTIAFHEKAGLCQTDFDLPGTAIKFADMLVFGA